MAADRTTRRQALRTGALAAIAASLLPSTSTAEAPGPLLSQAVNAEALAAECRRLQAKAEAAQSVEIAIEQQIDEAVGWDLMNAYTVANLTASSLHKEWLIAELARHLPGLAPTIRMLVSHIGETSWSKPGACCTVEEGFEA